MTKVEIQSVTVSDSNNPEIFKVRVDQPNAGHAADIYSFTFSGWVLGQNRPVVSLSIFTGGMLIKTVPVNIPRPPVAERYPSSPGCDRPGFNTEIGVIGLPETCEIDVAAVFDDGSEAPLAQIGLRRGPIETTYSPVFRPVMITSLGRSGSTWSMLLLGEHPEIVIHRAYPFETMAASYWIHLFKVLTDPANHQQSTARLGFTDRRWNIGHNPYFTRSLINDPEIRKWFGADLVARTAGYCQQNIDEFYSRLAESSGTERPRYFAEKNRGDHIPRLMFDLYSGAKEIVVLRDFRDMACSMLSFNRKIGATGVGVIGASDDLDFIRKLRPSIEGILNTYRERADRSYLIKYEDLVLAPETVLPGLLDYLEADSDPQTIRRMIAQANKPGPDTPLKKLLARFRPARFQSDRSDLAAHLQSHQTSGGDPARSVGRWKSDLSPELKAAAHESFGDLLVEAGYPISGEG